MITGFLLLRIPILTLAFICDMRFGDPPLLWSRIPHPVVMMGRLIAFTDRRLNVPDADGRAGRERGLLALLIFGFTALVIGGYFALLSFTIPLFLIIEVFIVFSLLASGSLLAHLKAVLKPLSGAELNVAQQAVGRIVGRDTQKMTSSDVVRAAIESAAESTSDGVVAPAFAYLFFGLPGLCLYKMINTADSMIGHKDDTYRDFGRASALFDDILNYIPARVSAGLIALVAGFCRYPGWRSLSIALRDAKYHDSPNAGWPEAAMAGALGIRLGGPRHYGQERINMPEFYSEGREWLITEDLARAIYLCRLGYVIMIAALIFACVIMGLIYI